MPLAFRIDELYRDFSPPSSARATVTKLLLSVPATFLNHLDVVVLTNAGALSHERKRERRTTNGRKWRPAEARGLYHYAWQGQPAWIELFVDNIAKEMPALGWHFPIMRDMVVGDVLYYEIGTHVSAFKLGTGAPKADADDFWRNELLGSHIRRTYWYLGPVINAIHHRIYLIRARKRAAAANSERPE